MRIILVLSFIVTYTHASESSVYDFSWLDGDKEVYVLQNRKFRKNGKLYLGGLAGRSVNGAFIDSNRFSLHAGYFFREDWGIEVSMNQVQGSTNDTHDAVNEQSGAVAFYRKMTAETRALIVWSPFYSKINTFNKIFYFDWMFGLGMSSVTTEDNRNEFDDASSNSDQMTEETNSGPAWMTAFRFYITENWSSEFRFQATHLNVRMESENSSNEDSSETRWVHYYNFNLGLNYTF